MSESTQYAIIWQDRKGEKTLLSDRFDDPSQANLRIIELIEAQKTVGARSVYHRVANSLACFTNWKDDFIEAWRVSVPGRA